MSFSRSEMVLIETALRLRAESCEDQLHFDPKDKYAKRQGKVWRRLGNRIVEMIEAHPIAPPLAEAVMASLQEAIVSERNRNKIGKKRSKAKNKVKGINK